MIQLDTKLVPAWPKLAWVAKFSRGADVITVYYGPRVETNEQWCVEAVWAGDFGQGDFDRTDLVFGSGIRLRQDKVIFVSCGTTLDRLWYYRGSDACHVSNSLPALLAIAKTSLADVPGYYAQDMDSILCGLAGYKKQLPCKDGELFVLYFHNLVWDGRSFSEVDKPDSAPSFNNYETYADYMTKTADRLAGNMNDQARVHTVTPLVTVSQGYDSSVAAVLARHAGCRHSVTIKQSTSIWRGSDSGEEVAQHLGLECTTCDRTAPRYPLEETIWAVAGRAGVLNWTLFDYPEPLCMFFTGAYGDKMWSRERWDYSKPFAGTGLSLGGIGEFRLFRGVFHCPVPFWGMRHLREVKEITFSDAMKPWSIPGDYDRPIPRRLVEQADVPRAAFGQRKKNTSHDAAMLWPYSPEAQSSFRSFLADHGLVAPGPTGAWMRRQTTALAHFVEANLPRSLTVGARHRRKQTMYAAADLLFQWANTELSKTYRQTFTCG